MGIYQMNISTAFQNALNKKSIMPCWLIWLRGKHINTGAIENLGLSTHHTPMSININGTLREYIGAGALVSIEDISFENGLDDRTQVISLSLGDPQVTEMMRLYETFNQPVQIHLALFDPATMAFIDYVSVFDGFADSLNIDSETITASLELSSFNREGTRGLDGLRKNDASQKLVDVNDKGREYADTSSVVQTAWGEEGGSTNFVTHRRGIGHRKVYPGNPAMGRDD